MFSQLYMARFTATVAGALTGVSQMTMRLSHYSLILGQTKSTLNLHRIQDTILLTQSLTYITIIKIQLDSTQTACVMGITDPVFSIEYAMSVTGLAPHVYK